MTKSDEFQKKNGVLDIDFKQSEPTRKGSHE